MHFNMDIAYLRIVARWCVYLAMPSDDTAAFLDLLRTERSQICLHRQS